MGRRRQEAANCSSQESSCQSTRGRINKGLSSLSIHFRDLPMTPGAGTGMAWLGTIMQALP